MNIHKFWVENNFFKYLIIKILFFFSEVIRYIFELYPNRINIQNDEHRTPLHLSASLGDIDTCAILIECRARVNSFIRTKSVSEREKLYINNYLFREII